MKTTVKFSIVFILIAGISIFITRCNTKQQANNDESTETTDADALIPDTVVIGEEEVTAITNEVTDTSAPVKTKTKIAVTQKPLTLIINNLKSETAPVIVSVYGTASKFPDPHGQLKEYKFKPNGKVLTAKIANLKFGTYAIATYQDENSSGEIDKNFIGMPTEGYAFSQNFKPTVKAPNFDQCKFDYNAEANTLTIKMIR